jgi:hypothetical protein
LRPAQAVTNVVRHAHTGQCQVAIGQQDGQLSIEVTDSGRGGGPAWELAAESASDDARLLVRGGRGGLGEDGADGGGGRLRRALRTAARTLRRKCTRHRGQAASIGTEPIAALVVGPVHNRAIVGT